VVSIVIDRINIGIVGNVGKGINVRLAVFAFLVFNTIIVEIFLGLVINKVVFNVLVLKRDV
jgi:hypothetical protein